MGTTSEELKKLYKKLGGKDPKVAGFSAPGEILNAINEIPLPTEYELPTVTTEDAGDVLVVNEEGKWDKGEAGSGVTPNPEGEATATLEKLGIDDTVYGIPKDTVMVEIDDNYNFKDPNMTVGTLHALCKIKNVVIHYTSNVNDGIQYFFPYGTTYLWRDSAIYLVFSRYIYDDKFYENPTTHNQYFLYGNITTGGSQKKLLSVQHTNPLLPRPSAGDSGKTLVVDSNNKWSIAKPSGRVFINATYASNVITFNVLMKEIYARCEAGEDVVVVATGSDGTIYLVPTFKTTANSYLFYSFGYNGNNDVLQFKFFTLQNLDNNSVGLNIKTVTPNS